MRTIIERALEVNKDLYLRFIDYTKAFDKVKYEEIINILEILDMDGKDLRIIKNLYWKQTVAVRMDNEVSNFQQIKRGVRQGCVLSPDLFSLYSEMIMHHLEGTPRIQIGGHNINNLRYADDTVLIAETEEDLQELLDTVVKESEIKGLTLNSKKTEVMVVSRKKDIPKCKVTIDNKVLQQVDKFKYLGTMATSDGKCLQKIKNRIAQTKSAFQKMKSVLTNPILTFKVRRRILQCHIQPIILYGSEAWTVNRQVQKHIETTEMWFLRRILRIPWTARKTNEEVLNEAGETRKLLITTRRR